MKDMITLLHKLTSLQSKFAPACEEPVVISYKLVPSDKSSESRPNMHVSVSIANVKIDVVVSHMCAHFSSFSNSSYISHLVGKELGKQKTKMRDKLYGRAPRVH